MNSISNHTMNKGVEKYFTPLSENFSDHRNLFHKHSFRYAGMSSLSKMRKSASTDKYFEAFQKIFQKRRTFSETHRLTTINC